MDEYTSYDLDGDGYYESFSADTNGDGYVDTFGTDLNFDGVADTELIDTNGDGVGDVYIQDYNADGVADTSTDVSGGYGTPPYLSGGNDWTQDAIDAQYGDYTGTVDVGGQGFYADGTPTWDTALNIGQDHAAQWDPFNSIPSYAPWDYTPSTDPADYTSSGGYDATGTPGWDTTGYYYDNQVNQSGGTWSPTF